MTNTQPDAPNDQAREQRMAVLTALGLMLAEKRSEAVKFKSASGVEAEWLADDEFYQGYDDANRHEFMGGNLSKPGSTGAPVVRPSGSIVFPNITQPYVDAVAARVGDMLIPPGARNYKISPTPIPDSGDPLPEGAPFSALIEETKQRKNSEAAKMAERAQTRIDDWLQECQYASEVRKVIEDAARLGSGVLKGPVPVNRKTTKTEKDSSGDMALVVKSGIQPASFRIDPWNLFPDPACGESIHNGSYIWERDYMTPKKLQQLCGLEGLGYLDEQIKACLEAGPGGSNEMDGNRSELLKKHQFEIWYCHIEISAKDLTALGCECEDDKETYPAIMTMVDDRVIRAALNPIDTGDFPYDVIPWKRRTGSPWGSGVARQIRTPQRIVTAAARRLMDNAGHASGPQYVIRRGVQPENSIWEVVPHKFWIEGDDSTGQVSAPFMAVTIPILQAELTNIIQLGMKLAEDVTGMPAMMQGQQGSAPDTVGGMTILNNNANSVLRRIARLFDSCITEPHIRRYYSFLMVYGTDPSEKGDLKIVALGSSSLVERDIQNQEMVNILQLCLNPAFGKNPRLAMDEYLRSRRFAPDAFDYTDDEKKKMAQQPPSPPLPIAVAQIRAQADMAKTDKVLAAKAQSDDKRAQVDLAMDKSDTDRDMIYSQAEVARTQSEHDARMQELAMKLQLAQLDYANREKISIDTLKTALARDTMKLQVQRELAMNTVPQVATPALEPQGRAPDGQAFQL